MGFKPENPYRVGRTLHLGTDTSENWFLKVTIEKVWPITQAVVMLVGVDETSNISERLPKRAILKMYDRRYTNNIRNDRKFDEYNLLSERHYQSLVTEGWPSACHDSYVDQLLTKLESEVSEGEDDDQDEDDQDFDEEENQVFQRVRAWSQESLLQQDILDVWATEHATYERLVSMQGNEIPTLYAAKLFDAPDKPSDLPFLPCGGLLLEYIDGQSLEDAAQHMPPSTFNKIYQSILSTIHKMVRLGVVNHDTAARDWLLRKSVELGYQPVQVDFGLTQIQEHESLQEWLAFAAGRSQEDRIVFTIKKLPACQQLRPKHNYYRFYQDQPASMDDSMFDVGLMVSLDNSKTNSSPVVHAQASSIESLSSQDRSASSYAGMQTPPDSLYKYDQKKTRPRSRSSPTSVASGELDFHKHAEGPMLFLSAEKQEDIQHRIRVWRQEDITIQLDENLGGENDRAHLIDLEDEPPLLALSHPRRRRRSVASCNIAGNRTIDSTKEMALTPRPYDSTSHHDKAMPRASDSSQSPKANTEEYQP